MHIVVRIGVVIILFAHTFKRLRRVHAVQPYPASLALQHLEKQPPPHPSKQADLRLHAPRGYLRPLQAAVSPCVYHSRGLHHAMLVQPKIDAAHD